MVSSGVMLFSAQQPNWTILDFPRTDGTANGRNLSKEKMKKTFVKEQINQSHIDDRFKRKKKGRRERRRNRTCCCTRWCEQNTRRQHIGIEYPNSRRVHRQPATSRRPEQLFVAFLQLPAFAKAMSFVRACVTSRPLPLFFLSQRDAVANRLAGGRYTGERKQRSSVALALTHAGYHEGVVLITVTSALWTK